MWPQPGSTGQVSSRVTTTTTYQCCKPAPPDADPDDAAAPEEKEEELEGCLWAFKTGDMDGLM